MADILVPAHFAAPLQRMTAELPVRLVPYDRDGVPQGDSAAASALFRWWLSVPAGDALIRKHPALRWIHTGSAGVDHILTPAFLESGITLTNSSGVHAASIAEWVVTAILACSKDLPRLMDQQRQHVWRTVESDEVSGRRAVIVGAGHIAREVAVRLRAFGVRVAAVRRTSVPDPAFDSVHPRGQLESLLPGVDWLIITAPLTDETRGLIDVTLLRRLGPQARVVNVARGEIVDEHALLEALRRGELAGAILDVFREEPLPPDDPIWDAPNLVVLPHTTWRSPQVRQKQLDLFVSNVRRFVAGRELENVVDPRRGY